MPSLAGDSGDTSFIQKMVNTAIESITLDIVIANAGITFLRRFFTYSHGDFFRVMQVNLWRHFFLAQAAAIQMKKQATWEEPCYSLHPSPGTRLTKTWLHMV